MNWIASGADGIIFWSGNRWHGGHLPHWGCLINFVGEPEREFAWVAELGAELRALGPAIVAARVAADVAVANDFDQRAALEAYPHVRTADTVMPSTIGALRRIDIGVDSINAVRAGRIAELGWYRAVLLPAAPVLEGDAVCPTREAFVANGGLLVVLPMVAMQSAEVVFVSGGLGGGMATLTGNAAISMRQLGGEPSGEVQAICWGDGTRSALAASGYFEVPVSDPPEVLARLVHRNAMLDGRAAVTSRTFRRGRVVRLAALPEPDALARCLSAWLRDACASPLPLLPDGVMVVPRTDGPRFVINTTCDQQSIPALASRADRLAEDPPAPHAIPPVRCHWLATT